MAEKKKTDAEKSAGKRPKGTGFAAPTIGVAVPDNAKKVIKPNGRIAYILPNGEEWRP